MSKILFATEIPTAHLDQLHPLVDIHFCIASECLKDPDYFHWYINKPEGCQVMLDNGMFEEGAPLDADVLFDIADAIKPNVVFAPDQVGDMHKTLSMTSDFIDLCNRKNYKGRVGVIPQGKDAREIVDCHDHMLELFTFLGPIGISFLNDRDQVVEELTKRDAWDLDCWYHFLGLYNLEEIKYWPGAVTSMDTIKPFKAAMHGYQLEDCPRGLGKWDTRIKCSNHELLYRNYAKMHQALTRV